MIWIYVRHHRTPLEAISPRACATLLMYRCENGMKLKFVSARDLSYDEELTDFNTDKPSAAEVYRDVKKAVERGSKQK